MKIPTKKVCSCEGLAKVSFLAGGMCMPFTAKKCDLKWAENNIISYISVIGLFILDGILIAVILEKYIEGREVL